MTDSRCKIMSNGNKLWLNKEGQMHRLDGPALDDGCAKWWYVDGKLHRSNGPAVEWNDGSKQWWVDDKCHRLEGPAIKWRHGTKYWYVYDTRLTQQQFNQHPLVVFYRLCKEAL